MKHMTINMLVGGALLSMVTLGTMSYVSSVEPLWNTQTVYATTSTTTYKVKKGDTLYSISKKYNVTVKNLQTWNKLSSTRLLVGQTLMMKPPLNVEQKPIIPPSKTEATYKTTANVNMRISPSTKGKIIQTIKKGTKVTVIGSAKNGWVNVSVNGKKGYVSSQYVTKSTATTSIPVVANPDSITVMVNKYHQLPKNFKPKDLVYTNVPFISKEWSENRKMRKEAAEAVSQLFAGAKKDKITLLGVSAYRSNATQTALFTMYVKKDGYAKASTYSAPPGTSEHETGLAIDVTGGNGKCAAQDCFATTKEAKWLAKNAATYGFIIRYEKGKEAITGYKYEPWHLRYVGVELAKQLTKAGLTMEEYYE